MIKANIFIIMAFVQGKHKPAALKFPGWTSFLWLSYIHQHLYRVT
jgi:hypothetical protein